MFAQTQRSDLRNNLSHFQEVVLEHLQDCDRKARENDDFTFHIARHPIEEFFLILGFRAIGFSICHL